MPGEQFSITFDGRTVEAGRISVRDLAPSLIALADAVSATSRLINPNMLEPGLEITAQRHGSFAVDLILIGEEQIWPLMQDALLRPEVLALTALGTIVSSMLDAIRFISWTRGRNVRNVAPIASGQVRVTLEDGSVIDLPKDSVTLTGDVVFRRAARAVIEPLARERVE